MPKQERAFDVEKVEEKLKNITSLSDLTGKLRSKRDWPVMLGQLKNVFEERIPKSAI